MDDRGWWELHSKTFRSWSVFLWSSWRSWVTILYGMIMKMNRLTLSAENADDVVVLWTLDMFPDRNPESCCSWSTCANWKQAFYYNIISHLCGVNSPLNLVRLLVTHPWQIDFNVKPKYNNYLIRVTTISLSRSTVDKSRQVMFWHF